MAFQSQDDYSFSLRNLQDELNRVFDRVWQGGPTAAILHGLGRGPAVDLYEFSDKFVLLADVPGVARDSVDVKYLDGVLSIKGMLSSPFEDLPECNTIRLERRTGEFGRSIEVPVEINADAISAKCSNGLLEVTLPKISSASARSVKVEMAGE